MALLPSQFETRATMPSTSSAVHAELITEPFAIVTRPGSTNLAFLRIIFWYIATGDSTVVPQEGTQHEGEDFETAWVDFL